MIKLISEVDYCEDYNYVIDFDNYFEESGSPIFIFSKFIENKDSSINKFSFDIFKQDISKLFDNIPNLRYKFDFINGNNGNKYKLLKIKYYRKCNKRLLDNIIKLLKKQELEIFLSNEIYVPTLRSLIKFNPVLLSSYVVHTKTGTTLYNKLTEESEIKIVFNNNPNYSMFIKLGLLLHLNEPENVLYLRYTKDDEYWTTKRFKQTNRTEVSQLNIISRELENIKLKTDLSSLKNINVNNLKSNQELCTRDLNDNAKYIYELIKKLFIFFNNNYEEIKQLIEDLKMVTIELKNMYSKLESGLKEVESKQSEVETKNEELTRELYISNLPKSEQKKLEEERKKKLEEEIKLEEERKIKAEETKKAIESINMIASLCGADLSNDPDMKGILSMYNSISNKEETEKKE